MDKVVFFMGYHVLVGFALITIGGEFSEDNSRFETRLFKWICALLGCAVIALGLYMSYVFLTEAQQ